MSFGVSSHRLCGFFSFSSILSFGKMSEHEHLEAETGPVTESVLSDPIQEKKPRNLIKKLSMVAGLILVIYLLYSVLHIFISPDKSIKQIYLVPQDSPAYS